MRLDVSECFVFSAYTFGVYVSLAFSFLFNMVVQPKRERTRACVMRGRARIVGRNYGHHSREDTAASLN